MNQNQNLGTVGEEQDNISIDVARAQIDAAMQNSPMRDNDAAEAEQDSGIGATFFFGLFGTTHDCQSIPAWHGVWRYNHGDQSVSTAFVGLNLILSVLWCAVKWVKLGGMNVAADPRQAFVDGLNKGHEIAVSELPVEVQNQYDIALAAKAACDRIVREVHSTRVAREKLLRFLGALKNAIEDNVPPHPVMQFMVTNVAPMLALVQGMDVTTERLEEMRLELERTQATLDGSKGAVDSVH